MSLQDIPPIGLGTFRLNDQAVQQCIRHAIHLGYRHIDTATIYKNEIAIGNVLQEIYKAPECNLSRSDIWLTTKLSPYDMKAPRAALLKSLAALQTEYLDLYLIHWPAVARKPADSPENKRLRIQAWNVLNTAKREGLVRHIGVSNFTSQHLRELMEETDYGIQGAFVQMEIHPWYWKDAHDIQSCFTEQGLVLVGYALLAEGKLLEDRCHQILDGVTQKTGLNRVQIAIMWALYKNWKVLIRSESVDHMQQNLEIGSWKDVLRKEDHNAIDTISSIEGEQKLCWDPRRVK